MRRNNGVTRTLVAILLAVAVCAAAGASLTEAATRPLVVVVRQGGLCVTGSECKSVLRITDTAISGTGIARARLSPAARRSLIRAIRELDAVYLRRHPFKGTCPTAYDAPESIYRFRGFTPSIPAVQVRRERAASRSPDRAAARDAEPPR